MSQPGPDARAFEGLSDDEPKANPVYAEKLVRLAADLATANADAVTALNARLPNATTTAAPRSPEPTLKLKRDLEKKVQDAQLAIDKKLFERYWGQAVFGYSGPTPTSDGKWLGVSPHLSDYPDDAK